MLRVGLDLSITAFNAAGTARYAACLADALQQATPEDVSLVPMRLPPSLRAVAPGWPRRALVLFWELVYTPVLVPLLARRHRLDMLHCPLAMPIGGLHCPLVVTILDVIPLLYPQWFTRVMGMRLRRWVRQSVRAATSIITISQYSADDLRRAFPGLAAPVYPVVLGSFLEAPQPHAQPADSPFILAVGTLEPRKNLSRALEAYAMLARERPDLPSLRIVGGKGWGDEDVPAVARRLGIAGRVELAGFVSDERLHELYATATMLVFPSLYEGFGFPVLEAMSMGCPVVTSDRSSLPEVAGQAALLVNPEDPTAIAVAMARLLDEPGLAARLRIAGARRARAFSWERCAQETLGVYRATARRAGTSRGAP